MLRLRIVADGGWGPLAFAQSPQQADQKSLSALNQTTYAGMGAVVPTNKITQPILLKNSC